MNNIKNNWKGIKSIIIYKNYKRVNNTSSDIPKCLSSNSSTNTNQVEMSNIFNNYFASIAEKIKKKTEYDTFSEFK